MARRVRQLETPKDDVNILYTSAEKANNVEAVTAENIDITSIKENKIVFYPRASSIYDECMRMHVLCTKLDKKKTDWINVQLGATFAIGNSVHTWLQNDKRVLRGRQVGYWKCLACHKISDFGLFPQNRCSCKANLSAYVYEEFSLKMDHPIRVTGHPDMFLDKGHGIIRVAEFKTMKRDEFVTLIHPLVKHVWQIMIYMRLCNRVKDPPPIKIDESMGYIIYVCKEHTDSNTLPYKVFPVRFNRDTFKLILDKLLDYQKGVDEFPFATPVVHKDCSGYRGFNVYRANRCPVKNECMMMTKPEGFKKFINI